MSAHFMERDFLVWSVAVDTEEITGSAKTLGFNLRGVSQLAIGC